MCISEDVAGGTKLGGSSNPGEVRADAYMKLTLGESKKERVFEICPGVK
jgi:hypothetical protein